MRHVSIIFGIFGIFTSSTSYACQIELYYDINFKGMSAIIADEANNLAEVNWPNCQGICEMNDKISSYKVISGHWMLCNDEWGKGGCAMTEKAPQKIGKDPRWQNTEWGKRVSDLRIFGENDVISSLYCAEALDW